MSHPFDAAGKDLLESDPAAIAALIGVVRPRDRIHLIDADLSTVSAAADKILRIDDEQPWLLHVEIQSGRDASISHRMLQYNSLLHTRHKLPVSSVLVLLAPKADIAKQFTGSYRLTAPFRPSWCFRYTVVRVWKLPAKTFLDGPPILWPLAPVARIARRAVPQVIQDVAARLRSVTPASEANKLFTSLSVFLQLRFDAMTAEQLLGSIENWDDLPVFRKVRDEGMAEGRAEGRITEARQNLLMLGQDKFGPPSPEVEATITAIADRTRLDTLLRRLLHVNTWDELLRMA